MEMRGQRGGEASTLPVHRAQIAAESRRTGVESHFPARDMVRARADGPEARSEAQGKRQRRKARRRPNQVRSTIQAPSA